MKKAFRVPAAIGILAAGAYLMNLAIMAAEHMLLFLLSI